MSFRLAGRFQLASEGTVDFDSDEFTGQIKIQKDSEVSMELRSHMTRAKNCGHQICLDYLSRVVSSEHERQSYCAFYLLSTIEPSEDEE